MNQTRMELVCRSCGQVELCAASQMLDRLQRAGVLRRSKDPDPDFVLELFSSSASRFACAHCGAAGLVAREGTKARWDEWEDAKTCAQCGQVISRERLQALPDTEVCTACQQQAECNQEQIEYCPRCGDVMAVRLASRGTTRYVMACPKCRYSR